MLTRHLDNLKSGLCLQMPSSGRGDRMQPMGGYITECLQTQRCRQGSLQSVLFREEYSLLMGEYSTPSFI